MDENISKVVSVAEQQFKYDVNEGREDFMARMISQGFKIVLPAENELQIDIDDDAQFEIFSRASESFAKNWWLDSASPSVEIHPSKSGLPSRHVTITLPFSITPWQRIALQASLGSDPMRELLSSIRLMKGDIAPTLFVEP
jgi:hypothetical protein